MKKLLIVVFVIGCAAVYAQAQFIPYGSARMGLWYEMEDEKWSDTGEEQLNMNYFLQSNSLVGARYRATDLNARVEFGADGNLRLLWAKYNMGSYNIHAGLDVTLLHYRGSMVYGNDSNLVGWGAADDNRTGQIRIELKNGLSFALLEPSLTDITFEVDDEDAEPLKNVLFPKINIGYQRQLAEFLRFSGAVGLNMYEYAEQENIPEALNEEAMLSFIAGMMFDFDFDKFAARLHLNAGQNTGNYGLPSVTENSAYWDYEDETIADVMSYGGFLELAYQVNDKSKALLGASFTMSDNDSFKQADTAMAVFGQLNHKLGNKVRIVPEVGLLDKMEDSAENEVGSMLYFGTQLRIDF